MKLVIASLLSALALSAQATAPPLRNTGKPMVVPPGCRPETIAELGVPCSADEPCQVYLDLGDVEGSGDRILVTGNLHTGTNTIESVFLVSDDLGANWTEAHSRIPFAVLDRIQFYGFESAWANGHLLQPLPRDPFFLISADGGKTWRKRPLSSESRPGAIEAFSFDSRTHGQLTIDRTSMGGKLRHELWESMTGGDSWNVLQVDDKPLKLRAAPVVKPWRIRPDAAAKAHRVERNESGTWKTVASFAVNAGECKVSPPDLPEEPVEPAQPEVKTPGSAAPPPNRKKP